MPERRNSHHRRVTASNPHHLRDTAKGTARNKVLAGGMRLRPGFRISSGRRFTTASWRHTRISITTCGRTLRHTQSSVTPMCRHRLAVITARHTSAATWSLCSTCVMAAARVRTALASFSLRGCVRCPAFRPGSFRRLDADHPSRPPHSSRKRSASRFSSPAYDRSRRMSEASSLRCFASGHVQYLPSGSASAFWPNRPHRPLTHSARH